MVSEGDKDNLEFTLNNKPLEIMDHYKYLGITFCQDQKSYLKEHQKLLVEKGWRLFGGLKHKIRGSYNRFVVGKTLWKSVAVPALTYGTDALVISDPTLSKLNTIQNAVGRFIIGANRHCAIEALNSDVGWSIFHARDAGNKLIRYKCRIQSVLAANKRSDFITKSKQLT